METLIFTPTWNESENIEALIREIMATLPDAHLLIVDDFSPDGTGDIAESLKSEFDRLHVMHRKGPRGRGWAGIAAYIWALDHDAQKIVEMDADFSHQPLYLPLLISKLDDADMVVGSRYFNGGEDQRPGVHRRLISRFANFYQQKMFGTSLKDCTSGYRAYRQHVLEGIGVRKLDTWGPAILSDVLYRVIRQGYKIEEIPIKFPDRELGESTLTLKILFEGIFNVLRLRLKGLPVKSQH